ncbi:MAG: hypothetical protein MZV65_52050 [Chromatiales bacterium]|nr:hypothetical protein [Chromatiales bacterium]
MYASQLGRASLPDRRPPAHGGQDPRTTAQPRTPGERHAAVRARRCRNASSRSRSPR